MREKFKKFIERFPNKEKFLMYNAIIYCFAAGVALEYAMINWTPFGQNFYETYKKKQATREAVNQLEILGELNPDMKDTLNN